MKYVFLLGLLGGIMLPASHAQLLSLQEATQIALDKNYGILIARNDAAVSANNAHKGAAGLLPTVDASAGATYNNNSVKVEFATPSIPSVDQNGAASNAVNAGINVNYVVFNGGGNLNTYRALQQTAELSGVQVQAIVEATFTQVANAYYQVARLSEAYQTLLTSMEISLARIERASNQKAFGSANKLAVLNAEVDFNTDSANLSATFINLENAKRSLNALIGRDVNTPFEVSTEVRFLTDLHLAQLEVTAMQQNSALKLAEYNRRLSDLNLKIAKSRYAPVLGLNAGYNFNKSDNGPGSILKSQQTLGFTVGGNLTFNLFSGNQRKVGMQNAELGILNSQYQYEEARLNLQRDLSNAFYTYQNSLQQYQLEQKSLEAANQNFSRTSDAFKLGQATNVQFREAQLNLQRVKDRLNDLRFIAKLNEIEVLRLSGQLTSIDP